MRTSPGPASSTNLRIVCSRLLALEATAFSTGWTSNPRRRSAWSMSLMSCFTAGSGGKPAPYSSAPIRSAFREATSAFARGRELERDGGLATHAQRAEELDPAFCRHLKADGDLVELELTHGLDVPEHLRQGRGRALEVRAELVDGDLGDHEVAHPLGVVLDHERELRDAPSGILRPPCAHGTPPDRQLRGTGTF